MEKVSSKNSIRLSMFLKFLSHISNLKCKVPEFYIIDYKEMPSFLNANTVKEWANEVKGKVLMGTNNFPNRHILAHPCPVDEYYYQDLSFAGVYESYKPLRDKNAQSNIVDGLIKVICGRYTDYSDYYYSRHKINGDRNIGIMFTSLVENCCMYGTAYVYKDKCLFDYYDSPLSIYMNDPKRKAANLYSKLYGYEKKIVESAFDIQNIIEKPLDIEFIVTRDEELYINQVRPISKVHLHNWDKLDESVWNAVLNSNPSSNVLNSIGTAKGNAIDLRTRKPEDKDFYNVAEKVYIVNHDNNVKGTTSLEFLKYINTYNVTNINLVLDHGKTRRNNHLQYAMFEDPGISFIVNLTNLKSSIISEELSLVSDGFSVTMNGERY